jgi:hypothetical protein
MTVRPLVPLLRCHHNHHLIRNRVQTWTTTNSRTVPRNTERIFSVYRGPMVMRFVPEKASGLLFKPSEQCVLLIDSALSCLFRCADGKISFAMFFPGEAMDRVSPLYRSSPSSSPKESVWALCCRSMLLWNFCICLRSDCYSDEDKAECALEVWAERQTIQDCLDMHVCNLNTTLLYIAREYLCKCVSSALSV